MTPPLSLEAVEDPALVVLSLMGPGGSPSTYSCSATPEERKGQAG
jgi:hypothetical protein